MDNRQELPYDNDYLMEVPRGPAKAELSSYIAQSGGPWVHGRLGRRIPIRAGRPPSRGVGPIIVVGALALLLGSRRR